MTCCKSCTESNVDQIKTIEIGTGKLYFIISSIFEENGQNL